MRMLVEDLFGAVRRIELYASVIAGLVLLPAQPVAGEDGGSCGALSKSASD